MHVHPESVWDLLGLYVCTDALASYTVPPATEDVPIFLSNLACRGWEASLLDCNVYLDSVFDSCRHYEDAGVVCQGEMEYVFSIYLYANISHVYAREKRNREI